MTQTDETKMDAEPEFDTSYTPAGLRMEVTQDVLAAVFFELLYEHLPAKALHDAIKKVENAFSVAAAVCCGDPNDQLVRYAVILARRVTKLESEKARARQELSEYLAANPFTPSA